jgi:hypothetical protein
MPDKPCLNVAEATMTAESDDVPVPKAYISSIGLPNLRGMKYWAMLWRALRPAQMPSTVVPIR